MEFIYDKNAKRPKVVHCTHYVSGIVLGKPMAFVPISQRPKAVYLLERSYHALQQWLFGQFLVMAFVGICTTISLLPLATPLVVALIVWVQVLYVKFTLGDYAVRVLGESDDDALNDKYTDTRYKVQSILKPTKQGDAYDAT